jgi:hypothetical protein
MSKENENVILNLRLSKELRDTFVQVCKSRDTTASRELREHIRKYISKYSQQKLI